MQNFSDLVLAEYFQIRGWMDGG